MSELIVDAFEAVHIQQDDAEGTLRAARAIEFGFQYAQQSAVIREPGERIADSHRANLLKKAGLVQQRAGEHHDVTDGLADFGEEKGPVKDLARERGGQVAKKVQCCYSEERVVIQAGCAFGAVRRKPLAKINRGREKQTGRKQIPWTRKNVRNARDWRSGGGEKCRAGQIRRGGYHQERTGSLTAWLAR